MPTFKPREGKITLSWNGNNLVSTFKPPLPESRAFDVTINGFPLLRFNYVQGLDNLDEHNGRLIVQAVYERGADLVADDTTPEAVFLEQHQAISDKIGYTCVTAFETPQKTKPSIASLLTM